MEQLQIEQRSVAPDEVSHFLEKKPNWETEKVLIVGAGPSFRYEEAWKACSLGYKVICINGMWEYVDHFADILYACDYDWVEYGAPSFTTSMRVTQSIDAAKEFGWHYIKGIDRPGLGFADCIHTNSNSGAQAINLAVLCGAKRIALLGFDMKLGKGGIRHCFGDYPGKLNKNSDYNSWIPKFEQIKIDAMSRGIKIINCTPRSALHHFPRGRIGEIFI